MKEQSQLGYVYYSASGFDHYGEYGHPEIRVFEFGKYPKETWHTKDNLISFTSQVDTRNKTPYGIRAKIEMESYRTAALKWAGKLERYLIKNNFYGLSVKIIIRFIKSHKMTRFINTSWIKDMPSAYCGYWIPYQYKKTAVAYIDAIKSGII